MTSDPAASLAEFVSPREGERDRELQAHDEGRRLSDVVASALLKELTSGAFAPGNRLPPEREMGTRFGVSRTVVREAIRSLASRGVVVVRPGSGVFVARADPSVTAESLRILLQRSPGMSYEKVYEVRETIEVRVVELAAERALASDFDQLRFALAETDAASAGEAFAIADADFHRILAGLAHNELFEIILEVVGGAMMEIRRQAAYLPGASTRIATDHRRIADAVMRRDAAGARHAVKDHLDHSRDIVRQLDEARWHSQAARKRVAHGSPRSLSAHAG